MGSPRGHFDPMLQGFLKIAVAEEPVDKSMLV
jgi:hypothetical protein